MGDDRAHQWQERLVSAAVMSPGQRMRLEGELQRFSGTVDILMLRLERVLVALALTFDAQAAARQRLNGYRWEDEEFLASVADLQTAAELYRHLARKLINSSVDA
jgi:hypothetical protein